jgi:hypothetical protein
MRRICIDIEDSVSVSAALIYVGKVMEKGRVSSMARIPQYCFACGFEDGTWVYSKRRRSLKLADGFLVRTEK